MIYVPKRSHEPFVVSLFFFLLKQLNFSAQWSIVTKSDEEFSIIKYFNIKHIGVKKMHTFRKINCNSYDNEGNQMLKWEENTKSNDRT